MISIKQSEKEIQFLINIRKERNNDYYQIFERLKIAFWNKVTVRINQKLSSIFTGAQCKDKFKSLVYDYKVSKNQ